MVHTRIIEFLDVDVSINTIAKAVHALQRANYSFHRIVIL